MPKYFVGTASNYDLTHYIFGQDNANTDPDSQDFSNGEDTPLSDQAKESPFFIRFQVRETGGKAGTNSYWQLYYNTTNDPATATQVTTTGDGVVQIVNDPGNNITNSDPTDTRIMSEFTGETYGSGEYCDLIDDTGSKYQLDSSSSPGYTEFMWCIQFLAGAGSGTPYYFYPRCLDLVMDSHSVHPQATTAAAAALEISASDTITVSDSATANKISPALEINVADTITISDSAEISITPLKIDAADPVSVADNATIRLAQLRIIESDNITISDSASARLLQLKIQASDGLTVAESLDLSITPMYSRGAPASLPANDDELANIFTSSEYGDVNADDSTRVDQAISAGQYGIFQFKDASSKQESFSLKWNGQASLAPSSSAIYLQIYNRNTLLWETLDSNNAEDADTDLNLAGGKSSSLSDYFDNNFEVACRVYQAIP